MNSLEPKIYVACLAAYNSGYLHGEWIDANQYVDSLYEEINNMLARSPIGEAEEWAIHDYEGFGEGVLSESTGVERVVELAKFLVEHGELGREVLSHFVGDVNSAQSALEENYHGEFSSEEDFAYYGYMKWMEEKFLITWNPILTIKR